MTGWHGEQWDFQNNEMKMEACSLVIIALEYCKLNFIKNILLLSLASTPSAIKPVTPAVQPVKPVTPAVQPVKPIITTPKGT